MDIRFIDYCDLPYMAVHSPDSSVVECYEMFMGKLYLDETRRQLKGREDEIRKMCSLEFIDGV